MFNDPPAKARTRGSAYCATRLSACSPSTKSRPASVLRAVVNDYLKRSGIEIAPHLEIDNYAMAISLVASTRGVALLPVSAEHFLPWSVVSRPLKGEPPTIDLVIGYHKANTSPILKTFLSKIDDLTTRISSKARRNH